MVLPGGGGGGFAWGEKLQQVRSIVEVDGAVAEVAAGDRSVHGVIASHDIVGDVDRIAMCVGVEGGGADAAMEVHAGEEEGAAVERGKAVL